MDLSPTPLDTDTGFLTPVSAGTTAARATGERAWLQAMLDAEAGLARAQAGLGMVPVEAARTISAAARGERFDLAALAVSARGAANPVVAVVQALSAQVRAVDPAAAEYVHRGSTSQDVLDTAAMLVAARCLQGILVDLGRVGRALVRLAEEHRDTVVAGRTLALHAVPTTFGLKVAGWLQGVEHAEQRLQRVADSLPVQLGGAAGTLAGYVEYARIEPASAGRETLDAAAYTTALVSAFAAEVGLRAAELPWHTTRTPVVDLGFALAFVTGALGKVAVDVQTLSRTEIAEVAEPAASGRGVSSAMPHKRNPALATLVRTAALQVPLLAAGLAQGMLAEDERPAGAWHAEWQPLRECLRQAGGAASTAAELVEGLTPDPARMRANLDLTRGLVVTERLAVVLAPELGKAEAKELMSRAAREVVDTGRTLEQVLRSSPEVRDHVSEARLVELLDPAGYTGVAGPLVDRAVAGYRSRHTERAD